MKKRLGVAAAALLLAGLAFSQNQQVQVQMDDTGVVIPAHQQRHVKNGQVVRFSRATAGGAWFVRFAASPCANGVTEFGSAAPRTQTCTIVVQCAKTGDAGCKTYHYASALAPNGPMHDPNIIVDP